MVVLVAVLIGGVAFVMMLGAWGRGRTGTPSDSPRATLAERGDAVGHDSDDRDRLGPKIADNAGIKLAFDYVNLEGHASRRAVVVDGVFGPSLDDPAYIHGPDSLTGERRTFRVDRIARLHRDGDPIERDIAWVIGNMVRQAAGQPLSLPPFDLNPVAERQVLLRFEGAKEYRGALKRLEYGYDAGKAWCVVTLLGAGLASQKNQIRERRFEIGDRYERPAEVFCGETGEQVSEPVQWLLDACGGQPAALAAVGL